MDLALTPEQDELVRTLRAFARKELAPHSREWDRTGEFPWKAWRQMGELGLLGVPAFMFQEGYDPVAEQAFREIARLTRGAYCRFDPGAAHQLGELLRAVAVYAAGGMRALADLSARRDAGAIKLIEQMR